jgi:hypothetical protein
MDNTYYHKYKKYKSKYYNFKQELNNTRDNEQYNDQDGGFFNMFKKGRRGRSVSPSRSASPSRRGRSSSPSRRGRNASPSRSGRSASPSRSESQQIHHQDSYSQQHSSRPSQFVAPKKDMFDRNSMIGSISSNFKPSSGMCKIYDNNSNLCNMTPGCNYNKTRSGNFCESTY